MSTESKRSASGRPANSVYRTTRDLTAAQCLLLEIMCEYQFGRVENMSIHSGQPVINHDVKLVRAARLGGESGGMKLACADEFELKKAVIDLFEELASLRNGTPVRLEFRHGLPCLLETASVANPASALP